MPDDGPPGRQSEPGPLASAGRMVAFMLLAGLGVMLLAAVVLLPAWARLSWARYERDLLEAMVLDEEVAARSMEQLITSVDTDPVLNRRLAMAQLGLLPAGEVVVIDSSLPATLPPGSIVPPHHPRPEPPNRVMTRAALRVTNPPTRRGLYLMSMCAVLAAGVLFGPLKGETPLAATDEED